MGFKNVLNRKMTYKSFFRKLKNQCLISPLAINNQKEEIVLYQVFASTSRSSAPCLLEKRLHCKAAAVLDEDKDQDLL